MTPRRSSNGTNGTSRNDIEWKHEWTRMHTNWQEEEISFCLGNGCIMIWRLGDGHKKAQKAQENSGFVRLCSLGAHDPELRADQEISNSQMRGHRTGRTGLTGGRSFGKNSGNSCQ